MEQKNLDFGYPRPSPERRPFTVSELTARIQGVLETDFVYVLVEGELSNLNIATSGHWYFSLKDDRAAIRAVVWKTTAQKMPFQPRDGMKVLARGGIRVYPPRGEYQLSVESLEPLGKGSLQQAFEDLKDRLSREGLFDEARKRRLPMLPRRIGVVTSPTGAVIQDILRVLSSRYRNLEVLIYPARVQGPEAAPEIVQGIRVLSRIPGMDVLILARGGGTLEELWPFNEERVARAIVACPVPTISAVGHETDFTISDFVADVRAPTPSAAAEQVVKAKEDITLRIGALESRLRGALSLRLARTRARVLAVTLHRVFEAERGRLRNKAQTIDEGMRRAGLALERRLERAKDRLASGEGRLLGLPWHQRIADRRLSVARRLRELADYTSRGLDRSRGALKTLSGRLDSLSPLAVLQRGYALVFDPRGALVKSSEGAIPGERVIVRVEGGSFSATVQPKESW